MSIGVNRCQFPNFNNFYRCSWLVQELLFGLFGYKEASKEKNLFFDVSYPHGPAGGFLGAPRALWITLSYMFPAWIILVLGDTDPVFRSERPASVYKSFPLTRTRVRAEYGWHWRALIRRAKFLVLGLGVLLGFSPRRFLGAYQGLSVLNSVCWSWLCPTKIILWRDCNLMVRLSA